MEISIITEWGISLLTLTLLEIILGVDNLVFISVTTARLPAEQQKKARRIGLLLAWVTRLLLLFSAVWISNLTNPLFHLLDFPVSGRDLFLISGGLFLLVKAVHEIHLELENPEETHYHRYGKFGLVILQIAILDIVFSLDSVITAIGLTQEFWIMALAISVAIIVMIAASEPLSHFVQRHPTIKMLAFSFLILIGTVLIADGMHFHIPRSYIYFSLTFSILVESLNFTRQKRKSRKKITS